MDLFVILHYFLCLNCTYIYVLYDYDLFHTCIILLTYGSMECSFFVCASVCACVYMYVPILLGCWPDFNSGVNSLAVC
jgi:hypothetical protein